MNPWTWLAMGGIAACGAADAMGWLPPIAAGIAAAACLWLLLSAWGRRSGGRHVG